MKVVKESIKNQIYDIIKERILSQKYNFGDPISIAALSSELGVSNTPIREALSHLESEGLVTSSYSSHVRVIDISEELISETNVAVLTLVAGAYDVCSFSDKIDNLIKLLEKAFAKQKKSLADSNNQKFIRNSIEFEKSFILATKNSKLLSLFEGLEPILFLLINYNYQQTQLNKATNLEQHHQLLSAVKSENPQEVHSLLWQHYDKHLK